MSLNQLKVYRAVTALVCLSVVVALDLFFSLFCSGLPLVVYLAAAGTGAWLGASVKGWLSGTGVLPRTMRVFGLCLAFSSVIGMTFLTIRPVSWDTKCAWRHCARALRPGLFRSPYPVGAPTCRGWSKCANEYPASKSQYDEVLRRLRAQGCPEP